MKLQLQPPTLAAPRHPQAPCAPLATKQALHPQPRLKVPLAPHANYTQTTPPFTFSSTNRCSRSLSHNPNAIEFP